MMIDLVSATDLFNYPGMFIDGKDLNAEFVVGNKPPAEDVIGISDIIGSLNKYNIGKTKLANEISNIYSQNLILVGTACTNEIIAELLGDPSDCGADLDKDQGRIQLLNEKGKFQLLVYGYDTLSTRSAAQVLANFENYEFEGNEILITKKGSSLELESKYNFKLDLSNYPDFLIRKSEIDTIIVVGDEASSSDVIAQTNLALSLGNVLEKPLTGSSKLASEVRSLEQNIISIGNACDNDITDKILNNPEPCDKDLEKGDAFIKLLKNGNFVHIVVAGFSNLGTKEAANVLINYDKYSLKGTNFDIEIEVEVEPEEEEEEDKIEDEKDRLIRELNKKIDSKIVEEEEIKEEKIEEEEEVKIEPIEEKETSFIQKIIDFFKSLFT